MYPGNAFASPTKNSPFLFQLNELINHFFSFFMAIIIIMSLKRKHTQFDLYRVLLLLCVGGGGGGN